MDNAVVSASSLTNPEAQFYDNTIVSGYKGCPRYYQLRHKLHWRREGVATSLAFGLSWHSGMDKVWEYAKQAPKKDLVQLGLAGFLETWEAEGLPPQPTMEQAEELGPRVPATAHEMLHKYIEDRWAILQEAELLASEQPFAVPLPSTANTWYIGRLDKVIQHHQLVALEHKTTTEYKKDGGFKTTYLESWNSDSQVKGYEYGGQLFFPGLVQVWVDAALVHKTVHDKFKFIPVGHHPDMLQEWVVDTRDWIHRIEQDNERSYFPKNENSCVGKYGACQFLDICRTTPDPRTLQEVPAGYVVEKWLPFEVLGLNKLIQGDTNAKDENTTNSAG